MALPVAFGIAGWSYPDWEGCVYPSGPGGKLRDKLAYVAAYVDMVEINSSFYRPPAARNAESWARSVASRPGFYFSAKLHQDVTHKLAIEPALDRAFHEGLRPLAEAGLLRHVLAQFRYDYSDTPQSRAHLEAVRDRFGDMAGLVLELRHNSWQGPGALDFLGSLGVTVANLDYPLARDSFSLKECRVGRDGYLRLHGRNRAAWFDKRADRDETYNYLYSREELEALRQRALSLLQTYRSLTVVANNHFRGKELANTLELKCLMTGERVAVPPALLAEYPRLADIAGERPS
ncbi:MAG: DUF72 domain-containing protein [Planctomycetes bacterium]|nr:DUF72 domain-containing protein [Planctomycetota bacterium]